MNQPEMTADGYAERIDARLGRVANELQAILHDLKAYERTLDGKPTAALRKRVRLLNGRIATLAIRMEHEHTKQL